MKFFDDYVELDELGIQYNTNKSSSWINENNERVKKNSLLRKYEHFLAKFRAQDNFSMLELGAGPGDNIGASCRVWKAYFSESASIHVADIKPIAKSLETEGIAAHVGDLGAPAFLSTLTRSKWDFVIDDASHIWQHQILGFRKLFPSVNPGGIYIVEDLCTSFGQMRESYSGGYDQKDAVSFFLAITRCVCGTDSDKCLVDSIYKLGDSDEMLSNHIDMIAWMGNSCIIVKK